jgi:murein DD-endopeptidase MepM/ murein hydrolase activator NlpD
MILASRHSWARLVAAIAFTIACMNVHVDAKQAQTKKQKTTAVKSNAKKSNPAAKTAAKAPPKEAENDSSVVKIDANDPKAFTKAILLDKQGVEFEVVGEEKQPAPKLVVKEKKNEDFFDFSTMLVPITHPAPIASKYGIRDHRLHRGVDVAVIKDEPVLAAFPGVVTMAKYNKGGYGHYVVVDHENGLQTLYGHLSERLVKIGDRVYPGDIVGLAGNSGRSSGAHLHFEIHYGEINIDPETIVDFPNWDLKPGVEKVSKESIVRAHYNMQRKLKKEGTYVVKKGDTQGKVAKWFNISIEALCRINNLTPGAPLKAGQRLLGSK